MLSLSLQLSILGLTCAQEYDIGEVVFSNILFRHGERMPLEFYPSDPHKNSPKWPFEIAQLTEEGRRQEYELGRWLRRRYSQLVSSRYKASEIFVVSTDVDRTLMSAQSCLAGFYSATNSSDPALSWASVPVHTTPVKDDILLGASVTCPCPAFNSEMSRVLDTPEIKEMQERFRFIYDYISNHTGKEVRNFDSALRIYDELAIEEKYNMSVPEWARFIYPEPVREVGLYSFVLPTWTTLLKRLKIGPPLKDMIEHFKAKTARTLSPDRNLWFYSAHDVTVASFLNTFEAFDIHFPPYASCVLLELRVINKKYFVTLFYRNDTTKEPQPLPILTCGRFCPLDQFMSLVEPVLPLNWAQECQNTADKYFYIVFIAATSLGAVIFCAMITILIMNCSRKSYSRKYFSMYSPTLSCISVHNPDLTSSGDVPPK